MHDDEHDDIWTLHILVFMNECEQHLRVYLFTNGFYGRLLLLDLLMFRQVLIHLERCIFTEITQGIVLIQQTATTVIQSCVYLHTLRAFHPPNSPVVDFRYFSGFEISLPLILAL